MVILMKVDISLIVFYNVKQSGESVYVNISFPTLSYGDKPLW